MIVMSCKEAGRLISEGLDRELDLPQRAGLRFHLLICAACSRVKSQLAFLHVMAPEYPGPDDDSPPKS
jgi:hypothetical protein